MGGVVGVGAAIGVTNGTVIGIASGISKVASGRARDIYITSKGLLKGINISRTIASLSKVKLS